MHLSFHGAHSFLRNSANCIYINGDLMAEQKSNTKRCSECDALLDENGKCTNNFCEYFKKTPPPDETK